MTCPFCDYEWKNRVEKPVECPHCKRYLPLDTPWAIREAKAEPESDVEMERRLR